MFSKAKLKFDELYGTQDILENSLVPVNGSIKKDIKIKDVKGNPNEEYYKWQFVYSIIYGGLYSRDLIGTEVRFPKGNKNSAALIVDAVIFDSAEWLEHYNEYSNTGNEEHLEWLKEHIFVTIEFKRNENDINKVFTGQIKPSMNEKDPSNAYVLGIFYNEGKLYIFHRRDGLILRYDEGKNAKGDKSKTGDLTLNIADPYDAIPSFNDIKKKMTYSKKINRENRSIDDLQIIPSIETMQVQEALSYILRAIDKLGLVNQRGYEILIQVFALKIFDEKRNKISPHIGLEFYVNDDEATFSSLDQSAAQLFIERMKAIWTEAEGEYQVILADQAINWQNINHVKAILAICVAFQDFSFISSSKSNLYQLVFYNFANSFKRDESAQFLTPLPIIDFIVKVVNPRSGESVFDPCCGIGDFLSMSYINSLEKPDGWKLNDANIYGSDVDEYMVMLTRLNMLLNGDGEAKLFHVPDKGSIVSKVVNTNPPTTKPLKPNFHKNGNWDNWPDTTKLKKFDVILTNPPFGEDRAYRVETKSDREIIEMYETWNCAGGENSIDLGVVFLENAYQILKDEGRLGIVLSNSIASTNKWAAVREWLMNKMRIVAVFDLPANVFAETGVNTSILIAYKPQKSELSKLNNQDYEVFCRDIKKVGYEKRTSKRNVYFNPKFIIDETTFDLKYNEEGHYILDEEFSEILKEFRYWANGQEDTLKRLFLKEN